MNTSNSHANSAKGRITENIVCQKLRQEGWQIIARNQHFVGGELDIVARDPQGTLVFVEVKSSWSPGGGRPQAQVHRKKQVHLWRSAAAWLARENIPSEQAMRFDVVSLTRQDNGWDVEHLQNAFEGPSGIY